MIPFIDIHFYLQTQNMEEALGLTGIEVSAN